jgi:hypothetical protein
MPGFGYHAFSFKHLNSFLMRPMIDSPKLPMSKSPVLQMLVVLALVVSMSASSMF